MGGPSQQVTPASVSKRRDRRMTRRRTTTRVACVTRLSTSSRNLPPSTAGSAVVLTFRSVSRQPLSSERQNQNRTSSLESLVSLCFRRSHERVPQSDASVGSGTLAHASTGSSHAEGRRPQAAVDAGERAELSRRSL